MLTKEQLFQEPKYSEEDFITYNFKNKKYKIWYGKIGNNYKSPILILHGGPGGNHGNLIILQGLGDERTVVFYDQLGCGHSDKPDDKSLWNLNRYMDEVEAVRKYLKLTEYHLFGHSWGTTLATAFAHKYPKGILSLSLASPILDFPEYINKTSVILRKNLPGNAAQIIDDFELKKIGNEKDYEIAVMEHLKRHVCLLFPNPPKPLTRFNHLKYMQVHDVMVGERCSSELNVTGNLKDVDVTGYLPKLKMQVFLSCGSQDLCTPDIVSEYSKLISNPEFHIFENSAHMTMLEKPIEFLNKHRQFIQKNDK